MLINKYTFKSCKYTRKFLTCTTYQNDNYYIIKKPVNYKDVDNPFIKGYKKAVIPLVNLLGIL